MYNMEKKYKSLFGALKEITATQYLAEFICKKSSTEQNKNLGDRFWIKTEDTFDAYWTRRYCTEILQAGALLKLYDLSDIIVALQHSKAKKIWSLHNKRLLPIIDEVVNRRTAEELSRTKIVIDMNTEIKKTLSFGKRTKFNKLQD